MSNRFEIIRSQIIAYLHRELLGPSGDQTEELAEPPHKRYLAGTLFPRDSSTDTELNSEEEDVSGTGDALDNESQGDDPIVLANQILPASMGLSFYLRGSDPSLHIEIEAGRYVELAPENSGPSKAKKAPKRWKRIPVTYSNSDDSFLIKPEPGTEKADIYIFDNSARVNIIWRSGQDGWLITVSLINNKKSNKQVSPSVEDCLSQAVIHCRPAGESVIAAYPRARLLTEDPEEHILDLLYRHQVAYGVGHGCSVAWSSPSSGTTTEIWTEIMPAYQVSPLDYYLPGYDKVLDIYFLAHGNDSSPEELITELTKFVEGYKQWIDNLPSHNQDIPGDLEAARISLIDRQNKAYLRMLKGVQLLKVTPEVRQAFSLANQAMLLQMIHSDPDYIEKHQLSNVDKVGVLDLVDSPGKRWRPFQLAFQLLTIASIAMDDDPDRELVDLIWFPTGGGKTEAYLAVTAFLIFYRRMVHAAYGAGTAVIMRYTLRLLTAQQFRRAATLICACELIRRQNPDDFGNDRISIGLWVGDDAVPNRHKIANEKYNEIIQDERPTNPFLLEHCPWCNSTIIPDKHIEDSDAYGIHSTDSSFWFFCPSKTCPFNDRLPVNVIDESLYQEPPTLLLATVDKFARLPWEERVAAFFGDNQRRSPDLIIQDELHLISGPLGTIVGIYETAVEALIALGGKIPKILASTATIRRADEQCKGLYSREVALFPPAGLDSSDSYFSRIDANKPGRLYLGILSPNHTGSTAMIRTSAALLQAPIDLKLTGDDLDAYWTLVAYHNSLRELGKSLTFGADDIPARIKVITSDQTFLRELNDYNVRELTSNIDASGLGLMLDRLSLSAKDKREVSLLLCTNMLSVGVDVPRLGLMLVNGQPKSTSEYIQATSRVGRSHVPGLVVCLYSGSKPRDRSHYERFLAYHSALYRHVEPTSVTPFARPSRDRALHAVLVSLVRLKTSLSANNMAGSFTTDLPGLDEIKDFIVGRVGKVDPEEMSAAREKLDSLIEEWEIRASKLFQLHYSSQAIQLKALLRNSGNDKKEGWDTLQSMRNVDRSCNVKVMGSSI